MGFKDLLKKNSGVIKNLALQAGLSQVDKVVAEHTPTGLQREVGMASAAAESAAMGNTQGAKHNLEVGIKSAMKGRTGGLF